MSQRDAIDRPRQGGYIGRAMTTLHSAEDRQTPGRGGEKRTPEAAGWMKRHGLSLAMLALFILSLLGQIAVGHADYNDNALQHGQPAIALVGYLGSGHFIEAVFENWESEFLQMAAFVFLSAYLYQIGSPDSRKLEGEPELDIDPREQMRSDSPWPVRRGGVVLRIYENSLTLALLALFAMSFFLHAHGGAREYSSEEMSHGGSAVSTLAYMRTSRFWFESLQNWQSEFLSVAALTLLSIFLRQRHSPQSKAVADPNSKTGG